MLNLCGRRSLSKASGDRVSGSMQKLKLQPERSGLISVAGFPATEFELNQE
jgi:hypothetical protein